MFTAYVVINLITIFANAAVAAGDFLRAKPVLANSAEVGVAEAWLPLLGALKAAGAAGLLIGLLGVRPIGAARRSGWFCSSSAHSPTFQAPVWILVHVASLRYLASTRRGRTASVVADLEFAG